MKYLLLSLLSFLFLLTACTNDETPELAEDASISEQVDLLIEQDEYESALNLLEEEDQTDPEIGRLLEKTHLNYGLNSMNTFDQSEMRSRMNNALVQFTEVLRINSENSVAREQIEQIMGVYSTIPDREPEPEVLEGLREVGFDY
ncbi:MAG: hypothetical protein WD381_08475 [Balneolaceae bacterium]